MLGSWAVPARAEVPPAPSAHGREFRVDFSARHLDVDAELGELSLSGDVEVTVGRYRLGGDRVRLKRGPRGIGVEGGGDIAFCSCDEPPVTLG
jgi:lipopolysaccharide export system protein LptA